MIFMTIYLNSLSKILNKMFELSKINIIRLVVVFIIKSRHAICIN